MIVKTVKWGRKLNSDMVEVGIYWPSEQQTEFKIMEGYTQVMCGMRKMINKGKTQYRLQNGKFKLNKES